MSRDNSISQEPQKIETCSWVHIEGSIFPSRSISCLLLGQRFSGLPPTALETLIGQYAYILVWLAVATTPRKDTQPNISGLQDHSQSILNFNPGSKKLPPLYIDQLKCGIRPHIGQKNENFQLFYTVLPRYNAPRYNTDLAMTRFFITKVFLPHL